MVPHRCTYPNTIKRKETDNHTVRERGRYENETGGTTTDDPPGTNRDLRTGQGQQVGANGRGTRRQKQECGVGSRDKRQRLAGGWWGQSPCGQRTTPEEDVGSGLYKEIGEAILNTTDGEAVVRGESSMIQKATETGGAGGSR